MKKHVLILCLLILGILTACDNDDSRKGRFLLKGNEKVKDNDLTGAIKFYSEALGIDPMYKDALYNRGLMYQRLNRLDEAIQDFTLALQNNPDDFDLIFQRGLAYVDNGEFYKAKVKS